MSAPEIDLVGVDGSLWHLTTGDEGVRLGTSVTGLEAAEWSQVTSQSARQIGRTYQSTRYDARKITARLFVGDTDNRDEPRRGAQWRALDAAFRRAVSPESPSRLVVSSEVGIRWWDVRLEEYAPATAKNDPSLLGAAYYNVVFVADNPWAQTFPNIQPVPAVVGVDLVNDGDVEAWPVWTVTGPTSGSATVTVGSGAQTTTLPAVTSGQVVIFDTDPTRRTVVDGNGVSRRGEILTRDLRASIPAQSTRRYAFDYAGVEPTVEVSVPYRFRSAW